jgi:mono/diheme cytochrome c family protein
VGGKIGPDLGRIQQNRSFSDVAANLWNHLPQMAGEARKRAVSFPHLDPPAAGDLIAFLFTLNYFDRTGSVDSGKKLFSEKRCIQCHQIGGVGGVLGPNLDLIGETGSPINVAAAMWNHGPGMAEAMRERGISRPSLRAAELRDLVAYFKAAAPKRSGMPVSILPGRVDEGRALFEKKQCVKCHSIQGKGGNAGPDLGRPAQHRELADFGAALWNKAPAMRQAMKLRAVAVPQLSPEEMADIVAYLRSVQYFGEPGNVTRGHQLLFDKQCLACHSLGREGAKEAPNLAQLKGLDSPAAVIAALWNHGALMVRPPKKDVSWSKLRPDEMADLMAFFARATRSDR